MRYPRMTILCALAAGHLDESFVSFRLPFIFVWTTFRKPKAHTTRINPTDNTRGFHYVVVGRIGFVLRVVLRPLDRYTNNVTENAS
jgi:hypothetical protein